MSDQKSHYIAVIGAGPAGLFGARELALAGNQVVLFNRDIKPGGLAEYGIYPEKLTMKGGLRKQFEQVLNARVLEAEGYGLAVDGELTEARLSEFLERVPDFARKLSSYSQDGNRRMLGALDDLLVIAKNGSGEIPLPEEDA